MQSTTSDAPDRPSPPRQLSASLRPITPDRFGYQQARHLLWRAGFGGTPEQIRTLAEWGPQRAVDHLLDFSDRTDYAGPASDTWDADIMRPLTDREREQVQRAQRAQDEDTLARFREMRQQAQRNDRRQIAEMQRWWLTRMIETPRPLEEKLTLFWHGHFATSYRTIESSYHQYLQNQLFRSQAAGSFESLLRGIIRDPAMLKYLDNDRNRRGAVNENLARELMELFSLGEGNRYTEDDIKEAARCLTGYTFNHNDFWFRENWHDSEPKRVLGRRGNFDGEDLVEIILSQSVCADYIAYKLYQFFVRDIPERTHPDFEPMRSVVERLGSTLRSARYEIRPMLRTLFLSEHFYEPAVVREKIKSPVELVVGAVRALRTPVRDLGILIDALDLMGQSLFFPPNVAGWSGGRAWINTSTLFTRQNLMSFLLTGRTPTGSRALEHVETYDPGVVLADLARADPGAERDPARALDFLLRFMLGGEPNEAHTKTLRAFVDRHGGRMTEPVTIGTMALITTLPEYQLC
ncbi:MAG: DUF1800 domain-containing protein [Phycisphaerales bacterium]